MTLTPEEIKQIEQEANELYPPIDITNERERILYIKLSTKHLLQLKSERERAGKLLEALEGVIRVADRKTDEFDAAKTAIHNYKNNQ